MTHTTLLPQLERELHGAAERLDRSRARRRKPWMRGWVLFGALIATSGVGVGVAAVSHFGPFSYLDGYGDYNPSLAATDSIEVQPGGDAPAWKAVALVNHIGQLCITGGPRDPRTNPGAMPTDGNLNNAPISGLTCADSDEAAQTLVDPNWPGASFAGNAPLDGSPDINQFHEGPNGEMIPVSTDYPTRMLVYAAVPTGITPVVRWGAAGKAIEMQPSKERLRLKVDKTRAGLSDSEYALVSTYPDTIDVVLWAADVPIPKGVKQAQVAFPAELPPHGVDDTTIEVLTVDEMTRLSKEGGASGWKYERGIRRDPQPVKGANDAQRAKIAAFARSRTTQDDVPKGERKDFQTEFERVQFDASRKLTVAGGGLGDAWIMPGGQRPEETFGDRPTDLTCFAGSKLLGDCKQAAEDWKRPMVEAISCASMFKDGDSFVWALTPPGAERIELLHDGGKTERLPARELVALRRQRSDQPDAIRWYLTKGDPVTVQVPWPKSGPATCGAKPPAWKLLRRDSNGGRMSAGGPSSVPRGR